MNEHHIVELDAETDLLFLIFQRAWSPTLGDLESPDEYLKECETLVDGTCRILKWLGLVEPDKAHAFGFKPTHLLESIVAKRHLRPLKDSKKACASTEDTDVLNSIFDAAVAYEDHCYVCTLARVLLYVLGLVRYSRDGDEIPTQELRQLAAERREDERNQRWVKAVEADEWPPEGVFGIVRLPTQAPTAG